MTRHDSSILSVLKEGEIYLEKHGVPNPRGDAEWILCHLLSCPRADLYLERRRQVALSIIGRYKKLLAKRGKREPLQYILGYTEFMSLPFMVVPGVFIPRFETELLVEKTEERLKRFRILERIEILDLCSGSGVIAISLAKRLTNVFVTGIDVSGEAVALSRKNSLLNAVADRTRFVNEEALRFLTSTHERYDAVLANPPYIPSPEIPSLAPEVKDYESPESIEGGVDGMDFYRRTIPFVAPIVKEGGFAAFEIGAHQGEGVEALLKEGSFTDIEVHRDHSNLERVVLGRIPAA